tara:strand:+ start:1786 stop:1932 length:147 start_codon:yes stop_codon:yes gene_type:complete
MSKFLNSIAAMTLVGWGIGFFRYDLGAEIHILLIIATALLIVKVILEK